MLLLAAFAAASTLTTASARPPAAGEDGKTRIKAGPPGSPGEKTTVEGAVVPIPAAEVKGPHSVIKPDETTHDFGSVWVGPPLKHAFKIKNEGDAPLEISRVRPSCGCTIAGDYPKKLDPGQEGEFPFSMMSTKLRGTFEKGITISSNDPSTPELRLKLRGEVKRYVEVVPTSANFGKITSQEPQERIVNIANNTDNPLKLTLVPPADSKFKFDLVEKTPGKKFDLHVTAAPPFEEGTLKGTLTINTNVEAQKDITVEVTAVVPARLDVQPTVVTLTRPRTEGAAPTEGLSRVIKFTNYGKTPTKVLEATVDDPTVTVTVTERKAGEAYTIQVQMPPGYEPPPQGRTITLKTDDAQKPVITVPIQAPPARPTVAERKQVKPAESLVGQLAPTFSLQTLEGKPLNNETLANNVAVLNFFAPNCGFCKKQIPRLEPIREKYADKGVRFVNVSEKMGAKEFSQDEVVGIIKGLGFKGELALDPTNAIGPLFKANSFPTMIVVGKTGKVEAVNSGNIADLETRLAGQIDALLAGKPVPTEAPAAQAPAKDAAKDKAAEAPKRARPEDMVGQVAPSFTLTTLGGKPLSNAELAKAPATVLNFFAPNCGFCKKQIPRLETVRKTYADKGVRFVNVAESMGKPFTEEDTVRILKDLGAELEVARDPENKVGPLFNATGYPTMVVVGKSGKVEAVNVGNVADLETRLQGQLDALIAGKPIPAAPTVAQAAPRDGPPAPPNAPKEAPKPSNPTAPAPAKPAPTFALTTVDGKPLSNAEFANAPATVLNFFAPNCGFCKKQIPRLETIRKTYVDKGVRFVNVVETMGKEFTPEETQAVLKELGAGLEVAHDPGNKVGPGFGTSGFPTMVVVGKSGKIEATNIGNIGDLETRLAGQLDALIAGKPIPTQFADAPPARPRPRPEDLVGKPTTAFSLTTVGGKPLSNTELAKAPATVLNFFAPNCGYCKKQIPRLETVRKTYTEKGVRFVNVVETMGKEFSEEETLNILKELGAELEVARDPGNEIGQQFNVSGFPTMVVVGKSGKVEAVNVGNVGDLETRLQGQLDALIAGKPIPQVAAAPPAQPTAPGQPTTPGVPAPAKPAPTFALTTVDGKPLSNAEFANAPATVLNFFAPNCGFCKKQIPRLETIRKTYVDKGVRFVNVVETMGKEFTPEETQAVLKELGAGLEVAHDPGNKVGPGFGTSGFPTMVVVGKSGKIEATNIGNIPDLETRLAGQLDAMIAGKPIPTQFADKPPAPPRPRPEDLVGKPTTAFSLTTVGGKPLSNTELANVPATVLNFFAPNCGYCKKQIPRLETVRKTYTEKGVRFVNVAETMGKEFSEEETLNILKELGAELEVARDPGNQIGQQFNVSGFPTMVVVGKSGKVEAVNVGNVADLETRLQGQLDALIAGKPIPQVAAAPPPAQPSLTGPPGPPPQPPQRPAMQLVGQTAPAFAIDTLEGKKVSSDDFKNHPATVLNFVAPNCGFCKKQLPNVEAVRAEYEAKGVRFVNIAQKMGAKEFTTEEMVDVFKGVGSRLELAKDSENKVGQLFKAVSYPTMVVVNKEGKIEHVNIGAQQDLDKSLKTQLDGLIAGKPAGGAPGGN